MHEPPVEAVAVVASVLLAGGGRVVVRGALAVLAPVALARRPRGSGGREGVGVLVGRPGEREAEALARLRTVADAGTRGRRRRGNALNERREYVMSRTDNSSATWNKGSIHLCVLYVTRDGPPQSSFLLNKSLSLSWKSQIFRKSRCE